MAHYDGKKNGKKREFKDMSGKGSPVPGQYRLDIEGGQYKGTVEQRPQLCKPYYAKKYWESFRDFLNASGAFGRTWHLYKQILNDPRPEELMHDINVCNSPEERSRLENQLNGVLERIKVMKTRQKCETLDELYAKAESDWNVYKRSLDTLLSYARSANVPIVADDRLKRNIMICFVLLDDKIRGACRREYYRKKFVNRSLKNCEKFGYADPISFYKMEEEYKADIAWQENYLRRKK